MSHRPTKVSPHVEARILLTTVAGRSSMDRMAEGAEHMVIETLLFIAFVVVVGAAVVKAYEWYHDVLYGPYMQNGSIEKEAAMIAISFTLGLRQLPAATTAWHLCTVIIPRRTITGRLVRGKVWRRHDGRHWLYKKFIA